MKLNKVLLSIMLVVPFALVPLQAGAAQGLTLLAFATPAGQDVGETVDIALESYVWGDLVDVGLLEVRAGSSTGPTIPTTNVSTGKYVAHFKIDAANVSSSGTVTFYYKALFSGLVSQYSESYHVGPGGGTAYPGWTVTLRSLTPGAPGPGDVVQFEARTYLDGALTDGGKVNATVSHASGLSFVTDDLSTSKQADGVYRFQYTIPAAISTSQVYVVEAVLGDSLFSPSDSVTLSVDPIPVMVTFSSVTASSATVSVVAGGAEAAEGATVSLVGSGIDFTTFDIITAGPFNATVDSQGRASVDAAWQSVSFLTWELTVEKDGNTTGATFSSFGSGWKPAGHFGIGCEASLQVDPAQFRAGTTAHLKFRVTEDGVAFPSTAMARFLWTTGGTHALVAGNASTDDTANMTLDFSIPSGFTSKDIVYFFVVCPKGGSDEVHVTFPDLDGSLAEGSPDLAVTATTASDGRDIEVTATYSGSAPMDGATAYAELVPPEGYAPLTDSGVLRVALSASGSTYSGTIAVPDWYPGGPYKVTVHLSNGGATDDRDSEVDAQKTQDIQVEGPAGGGDGNGGDSGGGLLPGFEGLAAFGACAVAASALAGRRGSRRGSRRPPARPPGA